MKSSFFTGIICAVILSSLNALGQGCSDAGFCSMGALRPDQAFNKESAIKLRAVELNQYWGESLLTPTIRVTTLDLTVGINVRNFIQVKIPYQSVEGNLTEEFGNSPIAGLGDISLSFTRTLKIDDKYEIHGTVGAKIASGQADMADDQGRVLHMYYQNSLGTHDLVIGGSYISSKWLFAAGFQVPLIHRNQNSFNHDQWQDYPSQEYLLSHDAVPVGMEFQRGIDAMIRLERNFRFSNYSFNVGLLPIYRLTTDRAHNPNTGITTDISGTTGLALSGIVGGTYHFNINTSVRLLYGLKITERDFNPDGLTRAEVRSIAFVYRF